ncbi:hypothetical protein CFBP6762_01572 [Xanthomonas arboricola pv. fragariae]|nr:hypothetical protein CFBP6762_01572 [Xanthomonas arboricola pv. fragariae]
MPVAPRCAPTRGVWRLWTRHTAVPHVVLVLLVHEFLSALCLIAVIEGLLLFAAPTAWKRMVEQLFSLPTAQLRAIGGVTLVLGAIALWIVRH